MSEKDRCYATINKLNILYLYLCGKYLFMVYVAVAVCAITTTTSTVVSQRIIICWIFRLLYPLIFTNSFVEVVFVCWDIFFLLLPNIFLSLVFCCCYCCCCCFWYTFTRMKKEITTTTTNNFFFFFSFSSFSITTTMHCEYHPLLCCDYIMF